MEAQTPSAASPTVTPPTTTLGDASAALAMADSSLATPATETPAASDAPAATQQAQPTDPAQAPVSTEQQPETKGEPPKWRWQDILANARETSAKDAETRVRQELEQQYAGLKDFTSIDVAERAGLLVWRAALNGDPQAIAAIKANPSAAQRIQSLFQDRQQAETPDPEPQPDFVLPVKDAQGNIVGEKPIYSAETQAKREAWLKRQWLAEVRKELQPLQQTAQTFQQQQAQATFDTTVSGVLAKMKAADPEFEKYTPDVAKTLQSDPRLMALALGSDTQPPDVETALELAWGRVHRSKVLPARESQTEATVLAKLQQQAVAGTVSPAAASASVPKSTLGDAQAALAHARAQLGG
jgi:hypothetical protein